MAVAQAYIDPAQLVRINDLEFLARTVVEGFMPGIHRAPSTGASIEFAQYRSYTQGDDLRFLDWKLYGRTDRLNIKQFRDETNLRCTLLLDCSGSMSYGSATPHKFDYARMLAASLAHLLYEQGDAVGLIAYHRELLLNLIPAQDKRSRRRLFTELANLHPAETTDTSGALRFLGDILRPRGLVVLISDLLHPLPEVIDHLKSLRARRHDVLLLQISDPAEQTFPFEYAVTMIDAEAGDEHFVVPDMVRAGYLENRARHFDTIREEAVRFEIDHKEFRTDEPLDHALRHFLNHRNRALKTKGSRAGNAARGGF